LKKEFLNFDALVPIKGRWGITRNLEHWFIETDVFLVNFLFKEDWGLGKNEFPKNLGDARDLPCELKRWGFPKFT